MEEARCHPGQACVLGQLTARPSSGSENRAQIAVVLKTAGFMGIGAAPTVRARGDCKG